MNAMVKYTLGRIGLFLAIFLPLLPVPMNVFLKLMIALLVSAVLALVLMHRWREEAAQGMAEGARRRRAEKDRLRRALAGEDEQTAD
jgi:hypothetical protein